MIVAVLKRLSRRRSSSTVSKGSHPGELFLERSAEPLGRLVSLGLPDIGWAGLDASDSSAVVHHAAGEVSRKLDGAGRLTNWWG